MDLILGIDVGTGGSRAVVVDDRRPGRWRRQRSSTHRSHRPERPGRNRSPKTGGAPAVRRSAKRCRRAAPTLVDSRHRPFRPDARRRAAGRVGDGRAAGDHLVRSTHRSRVPLADRHARRGAPARADVESRAHQFHAAEASVGSRARTAMHGSAFAACCCRKISCGCA